MEEYIKYIIVTILILVLDAIWIYSNFKMYSQSVRAIQKTDLVVNYYAAITAYVVVIFAALYVAIPYTKHYVLRTDNTMQKLYKAFIYAGATGFSIYAIYNLTSAALYKNYGWDVVIIDTLWGTFLNTLIAFIYLSL